MGEPEYKEKCRTELSDIAASVLRLSSYAAHQYVSPYTVCG